MSNVPAPQSINVQDLIAAITGQSVQPARVTPAPDALLTLLAAAVTKTLATGKAFSAHSVIKVVRADNPGVEIPGREARNIIRAAMTIAGGQYAVTRQTIDGDETDIYTPIA